MIRWWYALQRSIDKRILWPAVLQETSKRGRDIDCARAAFAYHALSDDAWLVLGAEELARQIDGLQP